MLLKCDTIRSMANEGTLGIFSLCIFAAPVGTGIWNDISTYCNDTQTPLIVVSSVGFFSYFRLHYPSSFLVVDSQPDPATVSDLRLLNTWDELNTYATQKTQDLEILNDHDHGHVPWLLLILHYLEEWKESRGGNAPTNYKEKSQFRAFLMEHMRQNNSTGLEENFEQAAGAVMKHLHSAEPNRYLKQLKKELEGETYRDQAWLREVS